MSIYKYVQSLLVKADINDVMRLTGYSRKYLWRIRRGDSNPGAKRLDRLLDVLDAKIIQKVKEGK